MKKLLLFLLLACAGAFGQVTVAPFTTAQVQFFDNSGNICAACQLQTLAAGTSTPLASYSDLGVTLNANPIILNSAGVATIFLTSASYKFVLKASVAFGGATLRTVDNITWATPLSTFAGITSTGNAIVQPSTAATGGANQSSPTLCIDGFYFNVTSLTDQWCLQDVLGTGATPTTTFTVTHTGSSGTVALNFPSVAVTFGNVSTSAVIDSVGTVATAGFERMVTTDQECWRNVANSGNVCDSDAGIAASGTGNLADLLKWSGGGFQGAAFVDQSAIPAASGVLRVGNNIVAVASRNSAGNGDVALIQGDNLNNILIPPPIRQTEIAAPSGLAGSDLLWADSTAHRWKMSNNNGTIVNVAGTNSESFVSPTINTGVTSGSGLKHQRFGASCTTGAVAGNTCTSAYSWTVAFADANYTVSCIGVSAAGTNSIMTISAKSASQVTITLQTPNANAASFGEVDCIAFHD